jgi:uncharacterized protein (TIGR00290 family)
MKVISLWSGGKDSCFACYKAIAHGHKVCYLLNLMDIEAKRTLSHGFPIELMLEQVRLTGIELLQKAVPRDNYEQEFKFIITELQKKEDIKGIVFGDIYLEEHRDWIRRICKELSIKAILPLWGMNTSDLITEFVNKGFEAIITVIKRDILDEKWLARKIDNKFIRDLDIGIDPCGEKGEFHTLVLAGPLFKRRLDILKSRKILKGENLHLDILSWRTHGKR